MRLRASLLICLLCCLVARPAAFGQSPSTYVGKSVREALDGLRDRGAPLVYSTNLVPQRLRVEREPQSTDLLTLAREIVAPHGLSIDVSGNAWLVVRTAQPATPVAPQPGTIELTVETAEGEPVADAFARVDAPNGPSVSIVAGRAEIPGVTPGKHVLSLNAPGFLAQRAAVVVVAGGTAELTVALTAVAPRLDEVTVTASRYDVGAEVRPSAAHFTQQQIETLSYLGDDALRIVHRLPGVASTDFSARSHVRGGDADEMSVIFDGMKLIEPFHLRDYQAVFSAVDQRIVSGVQVYSGAFPAEYGDVLSGLTVLDRVEPERLHTELGLSLLYTSLFSSGKFAGDNADWLVSARQSNLDHVLDDERGRPSFRDEFVHVGTALGAKHKLALNAIGFDDDILLVPSKAPDDFEQGRTNSSNEQIWLTLDSDWSSSLASRTLLYTTTFQTTRQGDVADLNEMVGVAEDHRELDSSGIKQDWRWNASRRHLATFGFDAERGAAHYEYSSAVDLRGVLATLASNPDRLFSATVAPRGEWYAVYASDRWQITDRLIADFGFRWDEKTYLPPGGDEQLGPRASLLYRLDGQTELRLSHGHFFQSQGLSELPVEDGVTAFEPAQDAVHTVLGVDHRFPAGLAVRAEVFGKTTYSPRARYENLFDPLVLLPELRPDRVRIVPERGEARGLEVLLSGARVLNWWLSWSLATSDDVVDGGRVPRSWDQRHALTAGLTRNVGAWTLSGVASMHTGWPTTSLSLVPSDAPNAVDGVVAVPGPRNAERLGLVRRIDFRASRRIWVGSSSLRLFAEVTNLTDRDNICCVRYEQASTPPGMPPALVTKPQQGLPLILNLGALWEFGRAADAH